MTTDSNLKYLVTGVSGQDGFFAARHFLKNGHAVLGISRSALKASGPLKLLSGYSGFRHLQWAEYLPVALKSLFSEFKPDRIVHAAGHRDLPTNEKEVQACFHTNCEILEMLLKSATLNTPNSRLLFLSSAEIFGQTKDKILNEDSPRDPRNAYALSKIQGMDLVSQFRERNNLFASSAICFNHDSFLSPPQHLTRLVPKKLLAWHKDTSKVPSFFNTDIKRDWSHAKDFVRAFDAILESKTPEDFVVATGKDSGTPSLMDYITLCAKLLEVDGSQIKIENTSELTYDRIADSSKLKNRLGWKPEINLMAIAQEMIGWEKRAHR